MTTYPTLFLIGAQKGGTTSLHKHLARHPEIGSLRDKEINLFLDGVDVAKRLEELGPPKGGAMILDGSVNYSRYPRQAGVPGRIHAHLGRETPKFIYAMRNPVDRLISQYHWNAQRYGEHRSLLEAAAQDETYVATGQYDLQVAQYLEYFDLDQFKFVLFEDFQADPEAEVNRILEWLGLSPITIETNVRLASTDAKKTRKPTFPLLFSILNNAPWLRRSLQAAFSDRTLRRLHQSFSKEVPRAPVSAQDRQELLETYFLPSIEATETLLDLDLSAWKTP